MNNDLQIDHDYQRSLIESGRLVVHGEMILDGVTLVDNTPPAPSVDADFGFIGQPDDFHCRPHQIVNQVRQEWLASPDPFKSRVAADMPDNFMFFDTQEQLDSVAPGIHHIFYHNHNHYFMIRGIHPLVDLGNKVIEGKWFFSLGNFNFPGQENRLQQVEKIRGAAEFWLRDKRQALMRKRQLGLGGMGQ
jgi:hypothetical protein